LGCSESHSGLLLMGPAACGRAAGRRLHLNVGKLFLGAELY
jgi:hypothetical protein